MASIGGALMLILVWAGGAGGHKPLVVAFATMQECQRAMDSVASGWRSLGADVVRVTCVRN